MHVMLVTPCYPLDENRVIKGGVSGVCYYLIKELAKNYDIKVSVLLLGATSCDRPVVKKSECEVHCIPQDFTGPMKVKYRAEWVRGKFSELGCDIIHSQGDASAIRGLSVPRLLTVHGLNERDTLFRHRWISGKLRSFLIMQTEGVYRKKISNVISINPYLRSFLSEKQRIWDIWNPVHDLFYNIIRLPDKGRMLYAGNVSPLKNVKVLIQSFIMFRKKHGFGELIIAGDTTRYHVYAQSCQDLVQKSGLTHCIHFLGSLNLDEMERQMSRCQILLLCSKQEVAPLVISEAMAAGIPVLGPNVCGVPYMVEEGLTGRLVDPHSYQDILRGMEKLLLEDDLTEMSKNAKVVAEERFRASSVAAKTVEVYRTILSERNRYS